MPCEMPSELRESIQAFVDYYNFRHYREDPGDVTPYDVYTHRYIEVVNRRKEA